MELIRPDGPVTSGLLAKELVTGLRQTGDNRFEERTPAALGVVGDPNDILGPTYATFRILLNRPPLDENAPIVQVIDRDGSIGADNVLSRFAVLSGVLVPETNHRLASVFEAYFSGQPLPNSSGQTPEAAPFGPWYSVTGLPITDAYWTRARVNGIAQEVLVQAFERRVLTYTPGNPAGSRVEMGNVGRHYRTWLAGEAPSPAVAGLSCPDLPSIPEAGEDEDPFVILGSALQIVGDRRFISGAVRNDGTTSRAAEVVAYRLDADGRILDRHRGFTDRDFWPSGQVAAFHIDIPTGVPLIGWRVEVKARNDKVTGGLAGGFAVEGLEGTVDGLGVANVRGRLRYVGDKPFNDLAIIRIHALDACGSVVTKGFVTANSGTIAPNSVLDFSTLLLWAEGATQLQAYVEARVGVVSHVADDALRSYQGSLNPAPRVPIILIEGCCSYTRAYQRPDGTEVRTIFRRASL
jgi:hypothetical protein